MQPKNILKVYYMFQMNSNGFTHSPANINQNTRSYDNKFNEKKKQEWENEKKTKYRKSLKEKTEKQKIV